MKTLAAFASGGGSNVRALWHASQKPDSAFRITIILADQPCGALDFAAERGIPHALIPKTDRMIDRRSTKKIIEKEYLADIDYLVLAGFMKIVCPDFIDDWRGQIVNIHPSLLPKYPGLHTHQRAIDAGETSAGCTVHLVDEGVDTGEIIAQAEAEINPEDTAETLARKVLKLEHKLYPLCVNALCLGLNVKQKIWRAEQFENIDLLTELAAKQYG